jgi:hypothetical protein
MGTARPQHRSQLLLHSLVSAPGQLMGGLHCELRLLDDSRPQHRVPPLLHSPHLPREAEDPPLGLVLRVVEAALAPHSRTVLPLHRSNNGPIPKNGSQGVDAFPRASRPRFSPTGPERLPAVLRM